MNWNVLPLLTIGSSLLTGMIIFCLAEHRTRLRTVLNLGGSLFKLALVCWMLWGVYHGQNYEVRLALLPKLELVLFVDALSLLFLSLSAVLWLLTTIYAIGYLEGSPHRSRFFGFFSLCISTTAGLALSGNLITLLLFYELLTLASYPLIIHRGTEVARRAGKSYLIYTIVGGTFLLLGTVWLYTLVDTVDFTHQGFLVGLGEEYHLTLITIFFLLIAGLGVKAALVPLHGWLPQAMIAPAPVSALLHAVAVVKAGAFGIMRVVYDVFGVTFATELGVMAPLAWWAAITIVYGSLRALSQDNLKRRLAFSTVSQISYIVLGIAIAGPVTTIGGMVHLVHQGIMKITLFFCAGNLAETLGIHKISNMNGVGRRMPWTMAAFTVGAFGMIGVPPTAGFISKWYLSLGALEAGHDWVIFVLVGSSLLNAAYFLPILHAAWFREPPATWPDEQIFGRKETAWTLLLPSLTTAAMTLFAGLLAAMSFSPLGWVKLIATREF